jgi:hypothetical protein
MLALIIQTLVVGALWATTVVVAVATIKTALKGRRK